MLVDIGSKLLTLLSHITRWKYKKGREIFKINSKLVQFTLNIFNRLHIQANSNMKMFTGLLVCTLFICYSLELSLAAPTHIKRDQKYRNKLYGEYSCRIQKAADAVRTKLNVSD